MNQHVRDLIQSSQLTLCPQVTPNDSVDRFIHQVYRHHCDVAVLSNESGIQGYLTLNDVMVFLTKTYKDILHRKEDVILDKVRLRREFLDESMDVGVALQFMERSQLRFAPILSLSGRVYMVSIQQLASAVIQEKDFMIHELMRYIHDVPGYAIHSHSYPNRASAVLMSS